MKSKDGARAEGKADEESESGVVNLRRGGPAVRDQAELKQVGEKMTTGVKQRARILVDTKKPRRDDEMGQETDRWKNPTRHKKRTEGN